MQTKKCGMCGTIFNKPVNCSKKEWLNIRKYCSIKCRIAFTKTLRRSKGSTNKKGYVYISFGRLKRVLKHRHVMEVYLGRPLEKTEHVHHINGDKSDNSIENLQVLSQVEHNKIHYPKGSRFGINSVRK